MDTVHPESWDLTNTIYDPITSRDIAKNGGKSKGNDNYLTPGTALIPVRNFAVVELDPAGPIVPKSLVFPEREYRLDRGEDGLALPWRVRPGNIVYCNPPYSKTRFWIEKADKEYQTHLSEIVMLIAARMDTIAVQAASASLVCFPKGRYSFYDPHTLQPPVDSKGKPCGAMFSSMFLYWGTRTESFYKSFSPIGRVARWLP